MAKESSLPLGLLSVNWLELFLSSQAVVTWTDRKKIHLVYAANHICMIASILECYLLSRQQKCCDLM
jgi:hypothetical protein